MAAGRAIDHIVLVVEDLDAAAERYAALGFTLTPRARHEDRMGTSNRLAQFTGRNFIELLEVDRPNGIEPHDLAAAPPRFSFGAHNRAFSQRRRGMSALVFVSDDSRADLRAFQAAGIQGYAPFDFERRATLPDGASVTVAFSLAFASSPAMPEIVFFTCHNRFPQHFWKPAFQTHANGAQAIVAIYLVAGAPEAHREFLENLLGVPATAVPGGFALACGAGQEIQVLQPACIKDLDATAPLDCGDGALFAGIAVRAAGAAPRVTPADDACGIFIAWRAG